MKDENGYALITVLLIIAVFMTLFLSFIGLTFSSVKQNQLVEKNSQSMALAEMGVSYYKTAVQNIYEANQQAINNTIKANVDYDLTHGGIKSSEEYAKQAVALMRSSIQQNLMNESGKIFIEGKSDVFFKLNDKNIYDPTDNNALLLKISGTEKDKSSTLSTKMTLAPIISGLNGNGGSTSGSYVLPNFVSIAKPSPPNNCQNPSSLTVSCSEILVDGSKTYSENVNGINNKTVFSTNGLTMSGNANKMENMKIHSENTFTVGKNMNNLSGTLLETKGDAVFGGQLRADSSKLIIKGNLSVDDHFTLASNSFSYIGGNAFITKHLTIYAGSKMCVAGNLTASQLNIGGVLVVKGTKNGVKTNISDQEFLQKCGTSTTPNFSVEWGETLLNDVNYEY